MRSIPKSRRWASSGMNGTARSKYLFARTARSMSRSLRRSSAGEDIRRLRDSPFRSTRECRGSGFREFMKKKYYAYVVPAKHVRGVTGSWTECEKIVSGVSGARYRGFKMEAEARAWLAEGAVYAERKTPVAYGAKKIKKPLESGIYFDAGTGRGEGVEISVTDERGRDLLADVLK